ncbi:MAG: zf-HC2 domain-containing protein [Limisphaerales bacterium]
MNHPTREDLVAHLYSELPPERQAELDAHLGQCAGCQKLATEWRGTMTELDAWQLPAPEPQPEFEREPVEFAQLFKWALAACLVVGLGFLGGRLTAPAPDAAALRAALAPELQKLAAAMDTKLAEDRRAVTEILQTMQTQRTEDYAALRRAIETLAVNTEDELQTAQQQIDFVLLASTTNPAKP